MVGVDANSGRALGGIDHLRQSIRDVLTTPIGTRVMRREYGSRLYELVDAPANRSTLLDIYTACAEALAIWEPRLDLQQITAVEFEQGRVVLSLEGLYLPNGEAVAIDGVEVA
jgi:Bacteriophage baseplate protein W